MEVTKKSAEEADFLVWKNGLIVLCSATKTKSSMRPVIIKLNLSGTTVHVNASLIMYYYAKKTSEGLTVTEVFFTEKFGLEVTESPAEIDALINGAGTPDYNN